jgi:hypothetical protein
LRGAVFDTALPAKVTPFFYAMTDGDECNDLDQNVARDARTTDIISACIAK